MSYFLVVWQVRELESIVKRRQKSDSCFPVMSGSDVQANTRLLELEKELSSRQDALSALHNQFLEMQVSVCSHLLVIHFFITYSWRAAFASKLNRIKNKTNTNSIKIELFQVVEWAIKNGLRSFSFLQLIHSVENKVKECPQKNHYLRFKNLFKIINLSIDRHSTEMSHPTLLLMIEYLNSTNAV